MPASDGSAAAPAGGFPVVHAAAASEQQTLGPGDQDRVGDGDESHGDNGSIPIFSISPSSDMHPLGDVIHQVLGRVEPAVVEPVVVEPVVLEPVVVGRARGASRGSSVGFSLTDEAGSEIDSAGRYR